MLTKERIAKAKTVDAKNEAYSLTEEEMEKIAGEIISER